MNLLKMRRVLMFIGLCAIIALAISAYRGMNTAANAESAQDTASLERRIGLLEQRFYSVEISLNRLEQQLRVSQGARTPSTSGERELELNLMRNELNALRLRLGEIECGLVRLDERTLAPAAREARKRAEVKSAEDPCRLDAQTPLRISARP